MTSIFAKLKLGAAVAALAVAASAQAASYGPIAASTTTTSGVTTIDAGFNALADKVTASDSFAFSAASGNYDVTASFGTLFALVDWTKTNLNGKLGSPIVDTTYPYTTSFGTISNLTSAPFVLTVFYKNMSTLPGTAPMVFGSLHGTLIPAVPEPESYAMFLAGLGIMGAVARRRSRV